jgi:hypothetical protein
VQAGAHPPCTRPDTRLEPVQRSKRLAQPGLRRILRLLSAPRRQPTRTPEPRQITWARGSADRMRGSRRTQPDCRNCGGGGGGGENQCPSHIMQNMRARSNSMQIIGAHMHLHLEAQGCKKPAFELRSSRSEIAAAIATITAPGTNAAAAADAVIVVSLWYLRGRCAAGLFTTADPRLQRSGPSSSVSFYQNEVIAIKDYLSPRMCAAPRRSLRAQKTSEWRPAKTSREEEAALQCITTARRHDGLLRDNASFRLFWSGSLFNRLRRLNDRRYLVESPLAPCEDTQKR